LLIVLILDSKKSWRNHNRKIRARKKAAEAAYLNAIACVQFLSIQVAIDQVYFQQATFTGCPD
jgi:hypothetical protein